jgi:outer membrane protein OmpA-like peptidoglycan-associated protein
MNWFHKAGTILFSIIACAMNSSIAAAQITDQAAPRFNEFRGDALIWTRTGRDTGAWLIEKKLKSEGIYSFEQMAAWNNADVSKFSKILKRDSRTLEGWRDSAKTLVAMSAQNCVAGLKLIAPIGIHHELGKVQTLQDDQLLPDRIAGALLTCSKMPNVRIEGHTDGQGDEGLNSELSSRRAEFIRDQLVKAGVPSEKLKTIGLSNQRPAIVNVTHLDQAQNRRVEICLDVGARPCPLPRQTP